MQRVYTVQKYYFDYLCHTSFETLFMIPGILGLILTTGSSQDGRGKLVLRYLLFDSLMLLAGVFFVCGGDPLVLNVLFIFIFAT